MNKLIELRKRVKIGSNPRKAKLLATFFKTGKGEYGEGDIFAGIMVPQSRSIAREFGDLCASEIVELLKSRVHEERLIALLILVRQFEKEEERRGEIFELYLENRRRINNWDLVDLSAPKIVGEYVKERKGERKVLLELTRSENIWDRRIAMLATFAFLKNGEFGEILKIAEILLTDGHDLIHKAVGWALREVGKRNLAEEEKFLRKHYRAMPRTMLRYAIERFPEPKRLAYLRGSISG